MRYFTSYLKKVIYYVTHITCYALPPTLQMNNTHKKNRNGHLYVIYRVPDRVCI